MNELKKREMIWIQIFYLFIFPVLLLYFNIVPSQFRLALFFVIALLIYGIIRRGKWTYDDLGIRSDWLADWVPYTIFTIGGILLFWWLSHLVPHDPFLNWWENKRFLILFIPISVLQEFLFRGVLMKMLLSVFKDIKLPIFINAILFALIHVIYANADFVLPLTFIGGIAFSWMYVRYPNLVLISIAHTIFNFTAMILGFFVVR